MSIKDTILAALAANGSMIMDGLVDATGLEKRKISDNIIHAVDRRVRGVDMTYEQKALEILRVVAQMAADGKSLTIAPDWGFGSATVIDQDWAHSHIGYDGCDDERKGLEAFVDGLHGLLVRGHGLSWYKPSNAEIKGLAGSFASPA